jgi:hypothetical protein
MGLYSSWPALALTNHALVRVSALRQGIQKFKDYFVIGDDVVIFNRKVAIEYQNVLDSIGVKTDPVDSFYCHETHSLEIAKRLFRRGLEVSPIPLRLFEKDRGLFQLYLLERGYNFKVPSTSRSENASLLASHLL